MKKKSNKLAFASRVIHAGMEIDEHSGAVVEPIYLSTLYEQKELSKPQKYQYSRVGNPTRDSYEKCMADLESGKRAFAFASGVAAIAAVLEVLLSGDHIIAIDSIYGGTYRLLEYLAPRRKFSVTYVDATNITNIEKAIRKNTKMICVESPSNPLLKIVDLMKIAKLGNDKKIVTVIDNTFATPWVQRPIEYGFDVVVHSTTKYLNGHSDVLGGIVVVKDREDVVETLNIMQKYVGIVPSPFDCYLTLRSIKTLSVRMERHCENALTLAQWLVQHPQITQVYYPGLDNHPQHELAKKQMKAFGGVITIKLKGRLAQVKRFVKNCSLFPLTSSLGGVESLLCHPATMSHASMPMALRASLGIDDDMIRLSIGIEDVMDLQQDLDRALYKSMHK